MSQAPSAKDLKDSGVAAAKIAASSGTDVISWLTLIKIWGRRIIIFMICMCILVLQAIVGATDASAECGIGSEATDNIADGSATRYPPSNGNGGADPQIVKDTYNTVKKRFGSDPSGDLVLLATFETALAE